MSGITERLSAALSDRYRIERELGAGGMATVFLAEDLKHKRRVALKVLKPELAAVLGAERFVQEITTTAALQHPHILPLFDSGTADGFLYYVMPFIDGETLRDKLNRETQLGVDEAVKIAVEVADALHYAHTQGVIHRDIKPENILLTNGRPMVADFGIALAVSAAAGGRMTETGLSLGTPHYMSPEQATAEKEISARSDVYSLASVLYEMLAGEPPHSGGSAQAIIMKIIAEPAQPVTKYRKSVPPHVAAAVAKALEKVPADRFASAKEFGEALTNAHFAFAGSGAPTGSRTIGAGSVSRAAFVAVSALAIVAVALAGWSWSRPAPSAAGAVRYQVALGPGGARIAAWRNLALSPDGRSIAFSFVTDGRAEIWVKTPDRDAPVPLPGTEGGLVPTFSPDGEWIAFVAGSRLRKIRVSGADVTTIADGVATRSAAVAWMDDGTLLFTGPTFGLSAVDRGVGPIREVLARDSLAENVQWIARVPGSRVALVATCSSNCTASSLWAIDLASGKRRDLEQRALRVWATEDGLVFMYDTRADRASAAPFDPKRLEFSAPPTPVLEDVRSAGGEDVFLAIAANGTMLHEPLQTGLLTQPVWVSRSGVVTPVDSTWLFQLGAGFSLSPDGTRLAVSVRGGETNDIWVRELRGERTFTRLTFGEGAMKPEWSEDGASMYYLVGQENQPALRIRRRRVDGADSGQAVLTSTRDISAIAALRDGRRIIVRHGPPPTRDIYLARLGPDAAGDSLVPLLADGRYEEVAMSLSPDERWMSYASNESGRFEVYVVPFPDVNSARWQVSLNGGRAPRWARNGKELFFKSLEQELVAVPVTVGQNPVFGGRRVLFTLDRLRLRSDPHQILYEPDVDDDRFLFMNSVGPANDARTILVQDWLTDVRMRLAAPR